MTDITMIQLVAIIAIAMGTVEGIDHEIQPGEQFQAPQDLAEKLIAEGAAKIDGSEQEPEKEPEQGTDKAKASKGKPTKLRLLHDGPHGRCNDLVELPSDEAKQLVEAGAADASKAAVAYAAGLPQNQKSAD